MSILTVAGNGDYWVPRPGKVPSPLREGQVRVSIEGKDRVLEPRIPPFSPEGEGMLRFEVSVILLPGLPWSVV